MAGPYYVKPASLGGSDSADGLTLATAWANIAKLNTESASFASDTTVYIYGYKATPLYMDAALRVRGNMRVIGVGDVKLWMKDRNGNLWVTSATAADLRPYKILTGPFTQPDSSGAPNCWQTSDTENTAVLFRLAGWADDDQTQPLVWLDHNTSNTASTISGAANSFNTNGTNLRFYSTTDPNTNGVTYVRTQPTAMTISGGVHGAYLDGANPRLENVAIGGTTAVANTSQSLTAGYAVRCVQETDGTPTLTNVFGYCGSNHCIGAVPTASCDDAVITWRNVRWAQGPMWSGVSQTPHVLNFGGGSGNIFRGYNLYNEQNIGVVNSATGSNTFGLSSFFMHNQGAGATELDEITIEGAYFGDIWLQNDAMTSATMSITSARMVVARPKASSTWTRCRFTAFFPSPQTTGLTTTLNYCEAIAAAGTTYHASDDRNIKGTYTLNHCLVDTRLGTNSGAYYTTGLMRRTGTLVFSCTESVLICENNTGTSGGHCALLIDWVSGTDTITLNRNRWGTTNNTFLAICRDSSNFTRINGLAAAGYEANSGATFAYSPTNLKLNTRYFPDSTSPVRAVAADGTDAGPRTYDPNVKRRAA